MPDPGPTLGAAAATAACAWCDGWGMCGAAGAGAWCLAGTGRAAVSIGASSSSSPPKLTPPEAAPPPVDFFDCRLRFLDAAAASPGPPEGTAGGGGGGFAAPVVTVRSPELETFTDTEGMSVALKVKGVVGGGGAGAATAATPDVGLGVGRHTPSLVTPLTAAPLPAAVAGRLGGAGAFWWDDIPTNGRGVGNVW